MSSLVRASKLVLRYSHFTVTVMRETQPFFINEMPITQGAASESLWGGGVGGER